jgi:hypothetical protein
VESKELDSFESLTSGLLLTNPFSGETLEINSDNLIGQIISNEEINIDSLTKDISLSIRNDKEYPVELFDLNRFQTQLRAKSIQKNKDYHLHSENISGHDLASGCSRSIYYRINNVPSDNYANKWLPVDFRCHLGSSVHEFIQDNYQSFTEKEVCLKVPSKRLSCRLDCLINNNVLVEIKSCNYADLSEIIKTGRPRQKDLYQAVLYKYLLENYLEEIKLQQPTRNGVIPSLDYYKITNIQLIYVCHELISGDTENINDAVAFSKNLAKLNNSKQNPFWFIQTINVDLKNTNVQLYENLLVDKLEDVLSFLNSKTVPPLDSKFIDKSACFFCLHSNVCKNSG